jgi:hypothetical protein
VGQLLGKLFGHPFSKFYPLAHLTLLDFEIVEMIPLAKRRHRGPREEFVREECSQACESNYIKWMGSCIEQVLGDVRGASTRLIPRWFRYISD